MGIQGTSAEKKTSLRNNILHMHHSVSIKIFYALCYQRRLLGTHQRRILRTLGNEEKLT